MQQEGIQLFCANIGDPISDGDLASFVYTCNQPGDVTLELLNLDSSGPGGSLCPSLRNITIHQIDPFQPLAMPSGMGLMPSGMGLMSTRSIEATTAPMSSDDMVEWVESLWAEEGVRELYSEEEWNTFVESVKDSY
jgi:hypothetical protein